MNRKKRNLQFIRAKNNLRLGINCFITSVKIPTEEKNKGKFLIDLIVKSHKMLLDQFNLDLEKFPKNKVEIDCNYLGIDYIQNIETWTCKINLIGK